MLDQLKNKINIAHPNMATYGRHGYALMSSYLHRRTRPLYHANMTHMAPHT